MDGAKTDRRQLLLQRAIAKVKQMKKGSAFITDWGAYEIIQELVQEILLLEKENQNLIEKLNKKT
tara:strand:+ start:857 stop:1051 length:195 start_codon:yes stop_codon:yes gene_type:complete